MVSFKVSEADAALIDKIVTRACGVSGRGMALEVSMDITACHANGCPLDLMRLVEADDFNFAHDIAGIRRHLDRTTGKLGGCFVPRFAA